MFMQKDHSSYNLSNNSKSYLYWLIEHCCTRSVVLKTNQRQQAELRVTPILTMWKKLSSGEKSRKGCLYVVKEKGCEQEVWMLQRQPANAWKEDTLATVQTGNGNNLNFYTECRNRVRRTVLRKCQLNEYDRCEKGRNEE